MKALLANLSLRDRRIIVIGVVAVLFLTLLYTWGSLDGRVQRMRSVVHDQQALDQWMHAAAQQVAQLRGVHAQGAARDTGGKSLLAVVDQTAKQSGLGNAIKRVEPDKENSVRVWFEQVAFDDMVRWLSNLAQTYAVQVDTVSVDRQDQPGLVNARLVLKGSGA
jgi:general secretion pathway protein M